VPRKPEYDFFDSDGLYKIYNEDDRNHIIAVCESVFDTMIVIRALNHASVSLPHDCSDEIKAAVKVATEELEEEYAGSISDARKEGHDEGFEEGKESRMPTEEIFDPS